MSKYFKLNFLDLDLLIELIPLVVNYLHALSITGVMNTVPTKSALLPCR